MLSEDSGSIVKRALSALAVAVLAGCGGGGSEQPTAVPLADPVKPFAGPLAALPGSRADVLPRDHRHRLHHTRAV